ncbi:MAG: hypothetical protein ACLU4J_13865 [Butyricimonas paravirosa]
MADMDPLWCESVAASRVGQKLYRDDIPRGKKAGGIIEGIECLSLGGKRITSSRCVKLRYRAGSRSRSDLLRGRGRMWILMCFQ